MKKISVIIPVLNDLEALNELMHHLRKSRDRNYFEVIIVDGGSKQTPDITECTRTRLIRSTKPGRAIQMNLGARNSKYDIFYFVHADTLPSPTFVSDINSAIERQYEVGGFRLKFNSKDHLLYINSFVTRFNTPFSGGGDQSLFITRNRFLTENGFNEKYTIMEDFEFVNRLRPKTGYHIIPKYIEASSRKYENNDYFQVNVANLKAFWLFKIGVDPDIIRNKYHNWLKNINRVNE